MTNTTTNDRAGDAPHTTSRLAKTAATLAAALSLSALAGFGAAPAQAAALDAAPAAGVAAGADAHLQARNPGRPDGVGPGHGGDDRLIPQLNDSRLEVIHGDLILDQPGQLVEGVRVEGNVIVQADNVTLRNSVVVGHANPTKMRGLIVNSTGRGSGYANATIQNVRIQEQTPSPMNTAGIYGSNFHAINVDITGQVDSIQITGPNVTIERSVLRDTVFYAWHPESPDGATHNDNIQILGGDNITVLDTRATGSQNFAFLGAAEWGHVRNLRVEGNYFDGGRCTARVTAYTNGYQASGVFADNVFGPNREYRGCAFILDDAATGHLGANTYASPEVVAGVAGSSIDVTDVTQQGVQPGGPIDIVID